MVDKLPFQENAAAIFQLGIKEMLKFLTLNIPGGKLILKYFELSFMKEKETFFFRDIVQQTLRKRLAEYHSTKEKRNDLIDLMITALKEDGIDNEEQEKDAKLSFDSSKYNAKLDETIIVATAMVMMIAGYDTTATTLAYAGK